MKKFVLIILLFTALNAFSQGGGYYIEEQMIMTSAQGGDGDSLKVKMWIQGDKFRREQGDSLDVTIGRLDKGLFWIIDPAAQTYSVMDLEIMRQMAQFTMMMMGAQLNEDGEISIPDDLYVRTGEKMIIGGWNAEKVGLNKKYSGTGMMDGFAMWISPDCGAPPELYADMMRNVFGDPNGDLKKIFKLWEDLNGYPVMIETSIMGVTNTTVTTRIEQAAPPDEYFQLPQGLTEVVNPMKEAFDRMKEE